MAEVLIQNMRDPSQAASIVVTIKRMIVPSIDKSNLLWVLSASTTEEDVNGDPISDEIRYLSSKETLTEDVNELISALAKKINWSYVPDTTPPTVDSHWPIRDAEDVSVETEIMINLSEPVPSSGIDMSSIKVKVKGFDLTNQLDIKGDFRNCTLIVVPGTKYKSAVKK